MLTHEQARKTIKAMDNAQDPTEPTGEPTGIAENIRKNPIGKTKQPVTDKSWKIKHVKNNRQ